MIRNEITIGDQKISYLEVHAEKKVCLFFIHGNSLESILFDPVFQNEKLNDYHLIAIDLPGHGESAPSVHPGEGYKLGNMLLLLKEFIITLELENVVLCGHSFGGHMAISLLPMLEDKAIGLAIFGTPPVTSANDFQTAFLPSPALQYAFSGSLTENQMKELASAYGNKMHIEQLVKAIKKSDPNFRSHLAEDIASGYPDECAILDQLKFDIGIFHGENDHLVNIDYIRNLHLNHLFLNNIHIIPDASHMCFLDSSKDFVQSLTKYVQHVVAKNG